MALVEFVDSGTYLFVLAMILTSSSVLLLGRFHAKKSLEPLFKAWQSIFIAVSSPRWWLAMVDCRDDGYLKRRVALAQPRGELPQIFVGGPALIPEAISILRFAFHLFCPDCSSRPASCHQLSSPAFLSGAACEATPHENLLALMLDSWKSYYEVSTLIKMGKFGQALVSQDFICLQSAFQAVELHAWLLGEAKRLVCADR